MAEAIAGPIAKISACLAIDCRHRWMAPSRVEAKAMISPKVAGWSTEARTKLRTVFVAANVEAGLLVPKGREHVVRLPVLSPETRDLVRSNFPPSYQFLLGGMS